MNEPPVVGRDAMVMLRAKALAVAIRELIKAEVNAACTESHDHAIALCKDADNWQACIVRILSGWPTEAVGWSAGIEAAEKVCEALADIAAKTDDEAASEYSVLCKCINAIRDLKEGR